MRKTFLNQKNIFLIIIFVALISSVPLFIQPKPTIAPTKTVQQETHSQNYTYKGQKGKDALTLLKQKYGIKQDKSGLVTTINGREADNSKHEYWAFYINSKMSEVGPAEYQTQDTDTIEWKIEKY